MSKVSNKIEFLIDAEDNWATSIGASIPGETVVIRGEDLFSAFYNKKWMELLLYSITGRKFTADQLKKHDPKRVHIAVCAGLLTTKDFG